MRNLFAKSEISPCDRMESHEELRTMVDSANKVFLIPPRLLAYNMLHILSKFYFPSPVAHTLFPVKAICLSYNFASVISGFSTFCKSLYGISLTAFPMYKSPHISQSCLQLIRLFLVLGLLGLNLNSAYKICFLVFFF